MIRETTYTGARQNLAALMDQVADVREPVVIRRRGKELVAASDLSAWMETDEELAEAYGSYKAACDNHTVLLTSIDTYLVST